MSEKIYKLDKFIVPEAAKPEFLKAVRRTHALLRTLPGFVEDVVLDQTSGPGVYNFATLVAWRDQAAIEAAREHVKAWHRREGIDTQRLLTTLDIKADVGNYRAVEA